MRIFITLLLTVLPLYVAAEPLQLSGNLKAARDISAAAFYDNMLLIGADEAVGDDNSENYIQLLEKRGSSYHVRHSIMIYRGDKRHGRELDIEGIAVDGRHIFALGSHALARKRIKQGKPARENLTRLATIKSEPSRNQIIRVVLDEEYNIRQQASISLATIIGDDPLLSRFASIPSKENGIDIEGIAAKDGTLVLGFRGPILRGGYVPILQTTFDKPAQNYRLHWLNLDGLGVRDLLAVDNGLLILAGPVADMPNDYRIYHWNGVDSLQDQANLKLLLTFNPPKGGKAEALALEDESPTAYRLLILFDGIEGGSPQRHSIRK